MKTIWKFPLKIADSQFIQIPLGAKLLSVGVQDNIPYVWAEVETSNPEVPKTIITNLTGKSFLDGHYIGTYQLEGAYRAPAGNIDYRKFVGHVYE